jgi:hypothetical protein
MILTLRDIMLQDTNLSMNRIILHIKNEYDIVLPKGIVQRMIEDSRQLVLKVREANILDGTSTDTQIIDKSQVENNE